MPDSYKQLIKSNPDETEIRSFLVDGDQVSVTLRIPDTLRDATKAEKLMPRRAASSFAASRRVSGMRRVCLLYTSRCV